MIDHICVGIKTKLICPYENSRRVEEFDRDKLAVELQQGRRRAEVLDRAEAILEKNAGLISYFAKDNSPDRHNEICMQSIRGALQPMFARKQEKPKWKLKNEEEKQRLLRTLKEAKQSDSSSHSGISEEEVAAAKSRIKQIEKALQAHRTHLMNADNYEWNETLTGRVIRDKWPKCTDYAASGATGELELKNGTTAPP